jgi:RNA polymerase-binding transcription factor DksA
VISVVDRSKLILEEARDAALARLASLRAEFDCIVEAAADANGDDEHDPEGATIAFERSRTASLLAETESALIDIEAAMARISSGAGTYARCEVCGGDIGAERLEARPATTLCVHCAATGRQASVQPE